MSIPGVHNVGKVLEVLLEKAGIDSFEKLCLLGAEDAFLILLANNKNLSKSVLYALEGAIQRIRWHKLDKTRKAQLEKFYNSVKASK
ncbi:MAG: TfoX/Sxy family DNA transformation protein [Bacteroidales bacterium]|nr:TfoX/Sxy family DNA transformation protein [Bacteroidales bacterium]